MLGLLRLVALMILGGVLATPLIAGGAPPAISAALHARLAAAAAKVVPKGGETKHPILVVDLGALGPAAVVLYGAEDQSTYSGAVVTGGETGPLKTSPLPPVNEIEGRFEMSPTAVFTLDDPGGRKALVVLYTYYINGSGQNEEPAGYVYAWDGKSWRIDDARTERLAGVKTAKAARAKLAK